MEKLWSSENPSKRVKTLLRKIKDKLKVSFLLARQKNDMSHIIWFIKDISMNSKILFQHNMAFHSARAVDGKSHCLNDFSAEQIKVVVEYFLAKNSIKFIEIENL